MSIARPPAMAQRLDLRQAQHLVMTPQLRQAIQLLQFSNLDVAGFIETELAANPFLERDDGADTPEPELAATLPELAAATERDVTDLVADRVMEDRLTSPLDTGDVFDPGTGSDGAVPIGRGGLAAGEGRPLDEVLEQRRTLRDALQEQIRLAFPELPERRLAATLLAILEPTGRLPAPPPTLAAQLGVDLTALEAVRARMQRFDPVGMFAIDLKDCLAVQLAENNRLDPAMACLIEHLDLVARRDHRQLMALCGVDAEDLADMLAELRALDPKPGALFDDTPLPLLIPDVLMRPAPDGDGWLLEMNPDTLPRLLVNDAFATRVRAHATEPERAYFAERLQSANWLVKSLQQRAETILRASAEIVRRQEGFFRNGIAHLRPLTLKDVADAVSLHESTISRVTANKYMATPRGTFELKFFFTTALPGTDGGEHSAEAVRHRIRALVQAEAVDDILSDDAIVTILRREGVDIARRTVAKYREALRIPSSVQRKRDKGACLSA